MASSSLHGTFKETVVGVFDDPLQAQRAVSDLRTDGYADNQIGVVSHNRDGSANVVDGDSTSVVEAGIATGMAAGAGAGALWGLAILAGTCNREGTLGVMLSSAAAGAAAAAGLGVVLASLGMSDEDADYYEGEFKAGRTIVTVQGDQDPANAHRIMSQYGSYNRLSKGRMQ